MAHITLASDLSPARRRLVALCHDLDFGRVERLVLNHGEPVFEPPPGVVAEVKLGATRATTAPADNFRLKPQVVELLRWFDLIEDGPIRCIEVQNGLPFRLICDRAA